MTVHTSILDGPLTVAAISRALGDQWVQRAGLVWDQVGAQVRFDGVVRRMEGVAAPDKTIDARGDRASAQHERPLAALFYETYEPMATRQFQALAERICERHCLKRITAIHSRGLVKVGETSFVLIVDAAHRREALLAVGEFIDALKCDVPIWKQPRWE